MARKTGAELQLKKEEVQGVAPESFDDVPDEFASSPLPPYPGAYRFKPPADLKALWDKFETTIKDRSGNVLSDKAGKKLENVERLILAFDKDDPLVIIQAPAGHEAQVGQPFTTQIRSNERDRARKGETPVYVSDLAYLIRAWGEKTNPANNMAMYEAANRHGGQEFGADLEWTSSCNDKNQVYYEIFTDAQGATQYAPEYPQPGVVTSFIPGVVPETGAQKMGCGKRYYMNDWKKVNGVYLPRHRCACGASLRPFGQLRNFRP